MKYIRFLSRGMGVAMLTIALTSRAGFLSLEIDGVHNIINHISSPEMLPGQVADEKGSEPLRFSYQVDDENKVVTIEAPLPVRVLQDGQDTGLALFRAGVDDSPGIITMDSETLSLGFSEIVNGQRDRYQVSFRGNEAYEELLQPELSDSDYIDGEPIDIELDTPRELLPDQVHTRDVLKKASASPLRIHIFKHNDLKASVSKITSQQFGWWIEEVNLINQQQMKKGGPVLFSEIILDFRSDREIQSFSYKGDSSERLRKLAHLIKKYQSRHQLYGRASRNKFILLTEHMLNRKVLGVAYVRGQYGMASNNTHQVAGHEIGHMLNGQHGDSEIFYNGWWCETTMYPNHSPLRRSCNRYSGKNRNNIADYLRR